jgi:hypothetical protein
MGRLAEEGLPLTARRRHIEAYGEHLSGLAPRSLVPARLLLKATPGECAPVAEGRSTIVPLQALMEMAPLASGWDPRAGIGAPSDVPAVDLAVAQLDGRRGPGYASRLQHADDLGPPSHNLTVRLHPVQVRMQQRLERAPITFDDRGMRD